MKAAFWFWCVFVLALLLPTVEGPFRWLWLAVFVAVLVGLLTRGLPPERERD